MSAPADRPLSLARLRALPVGAVIKDRTGRLWRREADVRTGGPGWFHTVDVRPASASYTTLHDWDGPLQLVAGEATP